MLHGVNFFCFDDFIIQYESGKYPVTHESMHKKYRAIWKI
jgi:hypothetical protein